MDPTHNVEKETAKPYVLVFLGTKVRLPPVDLNASQATNVRKTKHVTIRSVEILALELVELARNVKSLTTTQSVVVHQGTREIHLLDANIKSFNRLHPILVNHLHAGQTHNVASLATKLPVRVFQKWLEILHIANPNASAIQNALVNWLVSIKSAKILARTSVDKTLIAESLVTLQCATAYQDTLAILWVIVPRFDKITQSKSVNLVLQALVDRTLCVENKTALAHVHVLRDTLETLTKVADPSAS